MPIPIKSWMKRFAQGPYHRIPPDNFKAVDGPKKTLFLSSIQGKPIDLYVYNADTSDLVFGRADLSDGYPRELAHHIGIVRACLHRSSESASEKRFEKGAMDIAIDHSRKRVYFKHLTLGLEDMIFPVELEWISHIGSLQDLAMKALESIGMPKDYKKEVVKAMEWARIRTGLMRGSYIPYETWKKNLREGRL